MIKRLLYQSLKNHLESKEITLLVGPRQAGKTTLIKQLQEAVEIEGKLAGFLILY